MTIDHLGHLSANNNRQIGFTLIEMMVVIGLIVIITAYAVPGLKKAYESFKINETLDHISTFISSFRSYYLVMNEFPSDSTSGLVGKIYVWCLPSAYYTRTLKNEKEYYFRVKPYQGTCYDIDSWINSSFRNFIVTIYTDKTNEWMVRLGKKFSNLRKTADSINIRDFQEINGAIFEESGYRNRYY